MSRYRFLIFGVLVGSVLFLTGAFSSSTLSTSIPTVAAVPAFTPAAVNPDPAAMAEMDHALQRLDSQQIVWLEMDLWQQLGTQGLAYQAKGHYLAGPGHCFRLEMDLHTAGTDNKLQVICDGKTLWRIEYNGGSGWNKVRRIRIPAVMASLTDSATAPRLQEEFFHSQSFGGVESLLQRLHDQLTWHRKERVRRSGREYIKLTGSWTPEIARTISAPEQPWPSSMPRECRLYLDAQSLWPHRVEWWGYEAPQSEQALLLQMEFRNPILNRPLPPSRQEVVFSFKPATKKEVCDQTQTAIKSLERRAKQLANSQKTPPPSLDFFGE